MAVDDPHFWGVSVWDPGLAMMAGIHASEVMIDLRRQSLQALQAAQRTLPGSSRS